MPLVIRQECRSGGQLWALGCRFLDWVKATAHLAPMRECTAKLKSQLRVQGWEEGAHEHTTLNGDC